MMVLYYIYASGQPTRPTGTRRKVPENGYNTPPSFKIREKKYRISFCARHCCLPLRNNIVPGRRREFKSFSLIEHT